MKHLKRNSFIILLVTLLVLYFVLKDEYDLVVDTLKKMNFFYILLAVLLYFFYLILRAFVNYKWVGDKKKLTFQDAYQHMVITQFFNGITPFSTGGQPMEVYMLKQHGIRYTKATNIIMQNFIVYQIALVLFGFFAVIYNQMTGIIRQSGILTNLIVLGFFVNSAVALVSLFLAISEKFTNFSMRLVVKIGKKFHIVKNQEQTIKKWEERLHDFHQGTKEMKEKKGLFLFGIIINIIALACFYAIPLLLVYSLGDFETITITSSLVASAYVLILASFVPIPGATGGIEYGFTQMFGNFLPSSKTGAILIVWRFITYYLGMIVGGILFSFHKGGEQ